MRQLSVHEFDRVVIGVGSNIENSILTASVVLTLGVPHVWAKAVSHAHARILSQLGVHHVVRPEHDTGRRVAHLVRGRMLDYIEFDDGYAIVKTKPPRSIHGVQLGESRVRSRYGVTIVGVKRAGEDFTHATPETVVREGDLMAVFATGAYNYSMASNYNRYTRPAMVFVRDGNAQVAVERETLDDLVRLDRPLRSPVARTAAPR